MLDAIKAEAVARIQCDYGIENVVICPIAVQGYMIVHPVDQFNGDVIFTAQTEEECKEIMKLAKGEY